MTSDKGQTRPDGIDPDAPRSAPTAQEQADSVLSGEATHVDTGQAQRHAEEQEADSKPSKAAKKAGDSK
jgi:hypothetical protein